MDGVAGLLAGRLYGLPQLVPGTPWIVRRACREGVGLGRVHLLSEDVEHAVAETLGHVRRAVGAKAQALLRDEDEAGPGLAGGSRRCRLEVVYLARVRQEDDSQLRELGGRHGELVEVVLGVVSKDVDGLAHDLCRPAEDGHCYHHLEERRLELLGPLGMALLGGARLGFQRAREAARGEPRPHLGSRVLLKVTGHVMDVRGLVD